MQSHKGYTLLELSIALVIVALLAGGVTVGINLSRQAALRSVVQDIKSYSTSLNLFMNKYRSMPGDMRNATSYWGVAGGNGADQACRETFSTTPATCNGDGDGLITNGGDGSSPDMNEMYRAWQQLANAGLVNGIYSGVATNGTEIGKTWTAGVNIPVSRISGGGYVLIYRNTPMGVVNEYAIKATGIGFAIFSPTIQQGAFPLLTSSEAYTIDQKIDDGLPGQGHTQSLRNSLSLPNCVDSTDPVTARYRVDVEGINCAMRFVLKW